MKAIEAKFDPGSDLVPFGCQEFENLLGHWGASTDQPSVLFVEQLLQAYPEAKVVLVERNPDRWMKLYLETVITGSANLFVLFAAAIVPGFLGWMGYQTDQIARYYFNVESPKGIRAFSGRRLFFDEWRQKANSTYLAHNEHRQARA
ncbi:hypothetical protein LTR81_022753 [Elasticomyces elasticus]